MFIEELRSLRWVDFFLYTILDPRQLYQKIKKNEPKCFLLSFSVPVMVSFIKIITEAIIRNPGKIFFYSLTFGFLKFFIILVMFVFMISALTDLASQFFSGRGMMREKIILYNFALLPGIFVLPLVSMSSVLFKNTIPAMVSFIHITGVIATLIWSAIIGIRGLSEMHEMDFGKTFFMYFFPYLFGGVGLFLVLLLTGFEFSGYFI